MRALLVGGLVIALFITLSTALTVAAPYLIAALIIIVIILMVINEMKAEDSEPK